MTAIDPWGRRVLLLPGLAALVVGVLGGLTRVGWNVHAPDAAVLGHGPLMVGGFFGTLIALERAVALGARWAFAVPLASGIGVVLTLAGAPVSGAHLFTAAAVLLTVANLVIVARQPALFTAVMAAGSAAWAVGDLRWALGAPIALAVPWWLAFFVLTIAAERLELSRLAPKPKAATPLFAVLAAATLVATAAGSTRALGIAFLALAAWLAAWDVARRTIRLHGLPRFAAIALFGGYAWLAVAALALTAWPLPPAGPGYDAVVHAVMVGFVFSMVFAHAPIVLPAVARIRLPFRPTFYVPLVLLHAAVLARIVGDLAGWHELRRAGALATAVALAVFVATVLHARLTSASAAAPRS
ncbi:MAG: hypothetical protein U0610_04920 [bacterium]